MTLQPASTPGPRLLDVARVRRDFPQLQRQARPRIEATVPDRRDVREADLAALRDQASERLGARDAGAEAHLLRVEVGVEADRVRPAALERGDERRGGLGVVAPRDDQDLHAQLRSRRSMLPHAWAGAPGGEAEGYALKRLTIRAARPGTAQLSA